MITGSTGVYIPAFEPVAVLAAIARHRVRDFFVVPTMLRMLVDHPRFAEFDTGSIRQIRYGAARIVSPPIPRWPGSR